MNVVLDQHEKVADWVIAQLKPDAIIEAQSAIGVEDGGKLICGVMYSHYNVHDIRMDIAALHPKWCTRKHLFYFFAYPFLQLGCARVTGIQAQANTRAHQMAERLGFTKEGVLRAGWDGERDAWIYGMLKAECRWIGG